jgi:sodium-dependent dicarboxylate transporter 2/3/5
MSTGRLAGFVGGPCLFALLLLLPAPAGMPEEAKHAAAVVAWMATWWMSEAIPIPATALLPVVAFPLLGVGQIKDVAATYANPTVFLFMGGFFLATAMERWGLHRRIALGIIHRVGLSPSRIILGFMIATAFLSFWISNTATTVMMLPIALAVAREVGGSVNADGMDAAARSGEAPSGDESGRKFSMVLMLSIAYSATIGGICTIIGTPPNLVFAGVMRQMFPAMEEVTFLRWLAFGLPMGVIYLPLAWLYLTRVAVPLQKYKLPGSRQAIEEQRRALGAMNRGEKVTLATLAAATFLWIFRSDIIIGPVTVPGWAPALGVADWVHDATVALAAALFLFCFPVRLRQAQFALDWASARKIPWGILLLFGGGFAMAYGVHHTGLADWVGERLQGITEWPPLLMIATVALCSTLMSQFASNTAIATTFMPILGATAIGAGLHPFVLMAPGAMAATLGFMLPVSTPPNAIVFGTGYIRIPEMVRAGIWMDLVGTLLVAVIVCYFSLPVLGIGFGS